MARITVTLPDGKTEVIDGAIKFERHKDPDDETKIVNCCTLHTRTFIEKFTALKSDRISCNGIDPEWINIVYDSNKYLLMYDFDCDDLDIHNNLDHKVMDKYNQLLANNVYDECATISSIQRREKLNEIADKQ